jgi:two-component system response regulator NreC
MPPIRIFIVDDHALLRSGLKVLLNAQPDMKVIGECQDGKEAVAKVQGLSPDVVLMDISMPGGGGLEATKQICGSVPGTRVIMVTMHDNESHLRQSLLAGARAYVLKKAADTELIDAIRAVYRGEMFIYHSLTETVVGGYLEKSRGRESKSGDEKLLSEREREVLKLIAQGYTYKEVAEQLSLSIKTVETYKVRIMEKLNFRGRADFVRYALSHGWLESE